jgi:hypothetical protein
MLCCQALILMKRSKKCGSAFLSPTVPPFETLAAHKGFARLRAIKRPPQVRPRCIAGRYSALPSSRSLPAMKSEKKPRGEKRRRDTPIKEDSRTGGSGELNARDCYSSMYDKLSVEAFTHFLKFACEEVPQ